MRITRRTLPTCLACALLLAGAPLRSQDETGAPPPRTERPDDPGQPESYRLLGPPLFPFYDHYIRTSDQTEVLNVLYLYQSTRNPRGDASNLLFPFYYWARQKTPPDSRLYLFPLLFFHRSGAEASFNFLLPLLYDYRGQKTSLQAVAPIWFRIHDREKVATSHHVLFPLSRFRTERDVPAMPVSAFRLGIYRGLELFQTYRQRGGESRTSALTLLELGDEAQSRIALFHSESKPTAGGGVESRTHLFPLLWTGRNPESRHLHVVPLFFSAGGAEGRFFMTPLFGKVDSPQGQDIYLPPLLSRIGHGADGEVRRDLLWPLYHRSYGPGHSSFYSIPLFSYSWTPAERRWSLLLFLYANEYYRESGKTAHSFLWPLGRLDVEPDGVTGHRRFLPFYFDTFNDARRIRATPLFFNYQRRSGTDVTWSFTFALPDYFGWGAPDDYFGFGFPLFWRTRAGRSGWDLFIPVYFSFHGPASWGTHVLPLVSYNSFPSQKQLFLLGPTFIHRRFKGFGGKHEGSGTSLLWPLIHFERRIDKYHYRLLPLFWTSRDGDERDLLLLPLWYRQWGGDRSQNYFFPAYGRYESDRLRREFYGLGTVIRSQEMDDEGEVFLDRTDILWSLLSFQENLATHETHQHFYPLGFWRTRSVPVDRTIVGPLLYSHRIDGTEDRTYHLNLTGGNLWVSREVHQQRYVAPADDATARPVRTTEVVSSEKGFFWPMVRWGFDAETGVHSQWVAPFFFNRTSPSDETTATFPLLFLDRQDDRYQAKYFRYFFLFNHERWNDGYRVTIGQLLADYMTDRARGTYRWRVLYPLTEYQKTADGYHYEITPLMQGGVTEDGGQRTTSHFLFPIYWSGSTQQQQEDGTYTTEAEHLYVFPLFGVNRKTLRTQRDFLMPFISTERGIDSLKVQVRPFFFLRDDPEEFSVRLWPLHAFEHGEAAGDWWVSKYLYLSKNFVRQSSWSYRLEPFIFRLGSSEDSFGIAGLFELFAYDRKGTGAWAEVSYRALPFLYGFSRQKEGGLWSFPLYYEQDFGERPIDYALPWRFLFLFNHLRGGTGDRHTSLLWKVLEYRDNPRRPEYHEFRLLYALFQDVRDVNYHQVAMQPLFYYSHDRTDPLRPEKTLFIMPLLGYRYHRVAEQRWHYLLWFIPIWKT